MSTSTTNCENPLLNDLVKYFNLTENKAMETLKNKELIETFSEIIEMLKSPDEISSGDSDAAATNFGPLLYSLGTKLKPQARSSQKILIGLIVSRKITNDVQLNAALEFVLTKAGATAGLDVAALERACAAGIVIGPQELSEGIARTLDAHKSELLEKRYAYKFGVLLEEVKASQVLVPDPNSPDSRVPVALKFGEGRVLKAEFDRQLEALLGPRDNEQSKQRPAKVKAQSIANDVKERNAQIDTHGLILPDGTVKSFMEIMGEATKFHKPGENYKTDGYIVTPLTHQLMAAHLKFTGGLVVTRFPPEPNGILHIGHAKAINFNFGYAKANGGKCYLRYDDTNPEKEEERFFVGIREMVEWLGYKPWKVTHASDYFERLYELAVEMIRRGNAYVCHQRVDEIKGHEPPPSPWRDRPISESLSIFEDMRRGKVKEGDAVLRLKFTMDDGKKDPVAYRIKFVPHHRTSDTWCIYPTYDYTHPLNDSMENITHSLCTKEFQAHRSLYYWLVNSLDQYCPVQWEYGRLNMKYTVVSKRKIQKLCEKGYVKDWDDPRLYTLTALRRRGFPPEAINMFAGKVGVTMATAWFDPSALDACVRDVLNMKAPRAMAALEPLKLTVLNFPAGHAGLVSVPNVPGNEAAGAHTVPFQRVLYIDRSDFKEETDPNFKRLTPSQPVGLKYANFVITVKKVIKDSAGVVQELEVECAPIENAPKPKGFIQWVSDPIFCEIRLYERLFLHAFPEDKTEVPGGWESDINPSTLTVVSQAVVDTSVRGAKAFTQFQFERIGFFSVDPDTTADWMVFNRTITLREDPGKN